MRPIVLRDGEEKELVGGGLLFVFAGFGYAVWLGCNLFFAGLVLVFFPSIFFFSIVDHSSKSDWR